jgi:ketosteroid isomerase-like protein
MAERRTTEHLMEHTDAQGLAARLRAAYAESLDAGLAVPAAYVADDVEIVHEPAQPGDGRKPGAEVADRWSNYGAILRAAMPDVDVTVLDIAISEPDDVVLDCVLRGTQPDGTVITGLEFRTVFTLADGRIIRATDFYDPKPLTSLHTKTKPWIETES